MIRQMDPVAAQERYEFLDVLRGVALLGVVTANTYLYSLYGLLTGEAKAALPTAATDNAMYFLELWLVTHRQTAEAGC